MIRIEELNPEKLRDVVYYHVTEEEPDYINLSATSIDEAIQDWKEKVDDDPESLFDSKEAWELIKQNESYKVTVTAYKKYENRVMSAKEIVDDVITELEENDKCFEDNEYRSNPKILEAAEAFRKVVEEEVDPYYYSAFDILCYLNKSNDTILWNKI